jgi:hypothetical protein
VGTAAASKIPVEARLSERGFAGLEVRYRAKEPRFAGAARRAIVQAGRRIQLGRIPASVRAKVVKLKAELEKLPADWQEQLGRELEQGESGRAES